MHPRTDRPRTLATTLQRRLLTAGVAFVALALVAALQPWRPANEPGGVAPVKIRQLKAAPNPVTPGNFRGYGFDQCLAPSQRAMDKWLYHSPFLAVGIYISGNSRACRHQPNLTPQWIRSQLQKGWRLLPITLGPQASCHPGFPRYHDDPRIYANPGANDRYGRARRQARAEAEKAVAAARQLGIVPRSTLWYDLEGFDLGNTRCRESALAFLSAWTERLHALDYVSGVYSSAGSGIKMLDDARVGRRTGVTLPDRIWIARWDGKANTSTSYIRNDGWIPGGRVKQYLGGHNETWGGVTINIDRNFLDVGRGSYAAPERHCGGVQVDLGNYQPLRVGRTPPAVAVRALQCLLTERRLYAGKHNGLYNEATVAAVRKWQQSRGFAARSTFTRSHWTALLSEGWQIAVKVGSTGPHVRRAQRALNAADPDLRRSVNGIYTATTAADVRAYQRRKGLRPSGIVNKGTWAKLRTGAR